MLRYRTHSYGVEHVEEWSICWVVPLFLRWHCADRRICSHPLHGWCFSVSHLGYRVSHASKQVVLQRSIQVSALLSCDILQVTYSFIHSINRFVKQKRPNVAPNFNFLGQLMEFETYLRLQQRSHESNFPTIAQSLSPSQASNHGAFASTPAEELGAFSKAQEMLTPQHETDNRAFKCLQYSAQDGPSTLKMDSSSSRLSPSEEFISDLRYRCRTNSINQSGSSPSSLGSHESAEILQVSWPRMVSHVCVCIVVELRGQSGAFELCISVFFKLRDSRLQLSVVLFSRILTQVETFHVACGQND